MCQFGLKRKGKLGFGLKEDLGWLGWPKRCQLGPDGGLGTWTAEFAALQAGSTSKIGSKAGSARWAGLAVKEAHLLLLSLFLFLPPLLSLTDPAAEASNGDDDGEGSSAVRPSGRVGDGASGWRQRC